MTSINPFLIDRKLRFTVLVRQWYFYNQFSNGCRDLLVITEVHLYSDTLIYIDSTGGFYYFRVRCTNFRTGAPIFGHMIDKNDIFHYSNSLKHKPSIKP